MSSRPKLRNRTAVKTSFVMATVLLSHFLGACVAHHGSARKSVQRSGALTEEVARCLTGVWSVEHIEVFATEGLSSLSAGQVESLTETWRRTDRTNTLLRERQLTILHELNADGTYTHTLDWVEAPEQRFVESGTWAMEKTDVISCANSTGEASSLPSARVLYADLSTLIVRMDFEERAEIIRHCRVSPAVKAPSGQQWLGAWHPTQP
ncbi:MAG: hypothetical protein AAF368_02455 [Planctomycetota bacterium]